MFQKPTIDDLRRAAQQLHMNPGDDYLRAVEEITAPMVQAYAALDAMPDELPAVKYPERPWHRPQGDDNKMCIRDRGNYEGPHTHDLPVTKIIDIAFKARVQAFSIEAANPRHDHEWDDLKTIKIPDDRILIPGVIDSTTTVWPMRSPSACAVSRAMMSTWPPAGKPTRSRTGCVG